MPSRARCVGLLASVSGGRAHSLVVSLFFPDKVPTMAASTASDEAETGVAAASPPFCSDCVLRRVNTGVAMSVIKQVRRCDWHGATCMQVAEDQFSFRVLCSMHSYSHTALATAPPHFNDERVEKRTAVSRSRTRPER